MTDDMRWTRAMADDDGLLDALTEPDLVAGDPAGRLLAELRGALDGECEAHLRRAPLPVAAVVEARGPRRAPRRTARRLVALGGAVVLVTSAGGVAAAYTARPGSALWGLHRVLPGAARADDASTAARARAQALMRQAGAAVVAAERAGRIGDHRRAAITVLLDDADAAVSAGYGAGAAAGPERAVDGLRRRLAAVPGPDAARPAERGDDRGGPATGGADDGPGEDRSGRGGGRHGADDTGTRERGRPGGSRDGGSGGGAGGSDDGGAGGTVIGSDDGGSVGGSDDGGSVGGHRGSGDDSGGRG